MSDYVCLLLSGELCVLKFEKNKSSPVELKSEMPHLAMRRREEFAAISLYSEGNPNA